MSTLSRLFCRPTLLLGALAIPALGLSQLTPGIPNGWGTMHFHTAIGSFRFQKAGRDLAVGHMRFSFTGTVLVSGLDGTIKPTGAVTLEYNNPKHKILAYHGHGSMDITGKFDTIQWFGRDMSGVFDGMAAAHLYGEFDKNLNTGEYWFEDPKKVQYWATNGGSGTLTVPPPRLNFGGASNPLAPTPTPPKAGGGKKGG